MTKQWVRGYESKSSTTPITASTSPGPSSGQEVLVELVDARHVLNEELYVKDLRYTDVSSFGRTMVGLDEFVKYNSAFSTHPLTGGMTPCQGDLRDLLPDGKVASW